MDDETNVSFWKRVFVWKARTVNVYVQCCHECCRQPEEEVVTVWTLGHGGLVVTGENIMAELREGQRIPVQVKFKTKAGNPAQHQAGSVTWESSKPGVVSVEVDPADETKAFLIGNDGSGNEGVLITNKADGDPDTDSERVLISTADVVCTQGEAAVSELELGAAEDIPEVNPLPEEPPV